MASGSVLTDGQANRIQHATRPNPALLRNAHRSPAMMGVPVVLTCALAHGRLVRNCHGRHLTDWMQAVVLRAD